MDLMGLALAGVCLFVGTCALAIVSAYLEGRTDEVNLHVGTGILVAIVGGALFVFWGWTSTLGLMGFLTLWTFVGGVVGRMRDAGE